MFPPTDDPEFDRMMHDLGGTVPLSNWGVKGDFSILKEIQSDSWEKHAKRRGIRYSLAGMHLRAMKWHHDLDETGT